MFHSRSEVLADFEKRLKKKKPTKEHAAVWKHAWTRFKASQHLVIRKDRGFPISDPKSAARKRAQWRLKYRKHAIEKWIPHFEGLRTLLRGNAYVHTCTVLDELYKWRSELRAGLQQPRKLASIPEVAPLPPALQLFPSDLFGDDSDGDTFEPPELSVAVPHTYQVKQLAWCNHDGSLTRRGKHKAREDYRRLASSVAPRKRLARCSGSLPSTCTNVFFDFTSDHGGPDPHRL